VTYTIPASGGCAAVLVTTSVTITALPVATFSYTGTPYCSNAANPFPTFSGGGVAGTFSSTAGLVFVSTATGQVNLAASTAGTYTITNTIAASNGCSQVTATAPITINPNLPVNISISPSANPVCAGTSVTFTATPTNGGSIPAYQWKVNGINAGANNPVYTYTPLNGDVITCILTSNATCVTGNPATSNAITMTVTSLTVITVQPLNSTIIEGANTSFSVTATGSGLTYQWQENTGSGWNNIFNGGIYSGATTASLTLTGVTAGMNGYQYRCIVTGACGTVTSNSATLTVNSPPDITCPGAISHPTDPGQCSAALDPGFPTLVSGTVPITYTWVMTGATTGSGSGAIVPNPYTFNAGITTITWTATNSAGFDECTQTITVVDNQPPTFTSPLPPTFCVEKISTAAYWDPTMDIMPDRPEYYLFKSGDTDLDLNEASFTDNCPLNCSVEIRWRISFSDGSFFPALPSLYNTGQPSDNPSNIQFPGSVTGDLIHTITYQIADCSGNVSLPVTVNITIKPRPNIIKQP
jgi:hypothetical protein